MKQYHYNKRLLKLAAFLDKLPPQKFQYATVRRKAECGTVACAMGWCPAIFPKLITQTFLAKGWSATIEKAQTMFCLANDEAEYLFNPHIRNNPLNSYATSQNVAKHIRQFVANRQAGNLFRPEPYPMKY